MEDIGLGVAELDALVKAAGDAVLAGASADACGGDPDTSAKLGGDLTYRVVVDCHDEMHQSETLDRLEAEGFTCRPLIS